ncbi:hypothetical protein GCM10018780_77100 [Streptomyces lanatus]|nr:hypothetical protein GCM10018780_77100 [Streptomyces lanatus]
MGSGPHIPGRGVPMRPPMVIALPDGRRVGIAVPGGRRVGIAAPGGRRMGIAVPGEWGL